MNAGEAPVMPRPPRERLNYIQDLASQVGIEDRLDLLVIRMFSKPLSELTSFEESSLIDQVKAIQFGIVRVVDMEDSMEV